MTNPSAQLEDITAMIAKAREAVYDGKSIDMKDIQGLVKEACEKIQQSRPTNENEVHDKIVSIITNLNLLVEELKVQQNQIENEAITKGHKRN